MDHPDTITVAPHGDVIFAEDDYTPDANFLRGMTPTGELYTLARNAMNPGELAGPCFSPDGRVLFVNIYVPGLTLAITGPFAT